VGNPYSTDSGDAIYKFRHPTRSNRTCTECHVTHGSNAAMPGTFSANAPYPNGVVSPSSRLLKIDNRGTCQACHDPTGTVPPGTYLGPVQTVP
jgi:mono/diheme cytochrome c family protein